MTQPTPPVGITSLIDIHEVCSYCGSSIDVKCADALGLLAIEFWADRHKHHKAAAAAPRNEGAHDGR